MRYVDILYVDDNRINRYVVQKQLSDDFSVEVVASGEELYKVLSRFRPKVLILDWMMPEITGLQILKDLRSKTEYKDLIIVMLTSRNDKEDVVECLSNGANDYIVKPPHYPELVARIKSLLRQKRAEDSIRFQNQLQSYETLLKGITHEFNNIFAAFKLSLQMYKLKGPQYFDERIPQLMDFIQRGSKMIQDLRDFRHTSDNEFKPVNLRKMIYRAIDYFTTNSDFPPSRFCFGDLEEVFILGNEEKLVQVMVNLFSNSMHAMSERQGDIFISLSQKEEILILVEDEGIGMSASELEKLGNLFYTTKGALGSETASPVKIAGTGLGIATSKMILSKHNARIEFKSSPGAGTLAVIHFPLDARVEKCESSLAEPHTDYSS